MAVDLEEGSMVCHLDTGQELITPGRVSQARVSADQRPKTPVDLGLITENMSK